jgi:hypothetical protein
MHTATTAPGRPQVNRFTVVEVRVRGNQMTIGVRVDDENGVPAGEQDLVSTTSQRTGFAYDSTGLPVVGAPAASSAGFLTADFAAFAEHPNGTTFATRAAALEARLVSTGRFPA